MRYTSESSRAENSGMRQPFSLANTSANAMSCGLNPWQSASFASADPTAQNSMTPSDPAMHAWIQTQRQNYEQALVWRFLTCFCPRKSAESEINVKLTAREASSGEISAQFRSNLARPLQHCAKSDAPKFGRCCCILFFKPCSRTALGCSWYCSRESAEIPEHLVSALRDKR